MNKFIPHLRTSCFAASLLTTNAAFASDIIGAGATFPYPIYSKWAEVYRAKTHISLNYQSIGSGGGIKQVQAKAVDFGASDMPLKPAELEKNGLVQFPSVVGGVVPVININGIEAGQLKLDGKTLADIYLGKITRWNDSAIAALNPDIKLPNEDIAVIYRTDSSGTSFIFTHYLSKVSPEWQSTVGEGTSVIWKVGVGGRGNEGVTSYVQRIKNSIAYVEYSYALQNKLDYVQLKNHDGNFIIPNKASLAAAAVAVHWDQTPGFYEILTDEAGKNSWPLASATFILMQKTQDKPDTAKLVLKFFDWAYAYGDKMASDLNYIPIPDNAVKQIHQAWKTQIRDTSGKPIWKQ
ncbi:MAG: phosphate ABC transporter substrate-binding protein PstS [Nitrosomonadales bacterium]|nr:phosphate ABC transporter substrate-binding protein PstS [Nitrosomonadales bacterium]